MDTEQVLRTKDGYKLGFATYGDPHGIPVFFFHGFPGSRYEIMPLDSLLLQLGTHLIAPERPGLGLSSFRRNWKMTDWPEDVLKIADYLNIDRFAVCGASGGGPFALACAWKIPNRLSSTSIIASIGPITEPGITIGMKEKNLRSFEMAKRSPWMLHFIYFIAQFMDPEKAQKKSLNKMIEPDRLVMQRPEMQQMAVRDAKAALRQGPRGLTQHVILYANDWGFKLSDIKTKIHLWQGEMDVNVPPIMGHYMAEHLSNCTSHFLPDDGHYSLPFNHAEAIFREAIQDE